jgi:adenylate kinase
MSNFEIETQINYDYDKDKNNIIIDKPELSLCSFTKPAIYCIYGIRNTGKTTLIKDIYKNIETNSKNVNYIAFTHNLHREEYDPLYTYEGYNENIISKILTSQKQLIKNNKKRHLVVILDDVMVSRKDTLANIFYELIFNARCYHISIILSLQYPSLLPPSIRANFDYIFISTNDYIISHRKKYYEQYGTFTSLEKFNQIMDKNKLHKYSFLCLINNSPTNIKYMYYNPPYIVSIDTNNTDIL